MNLRKRILTSLVILLILPMVMVIIGVMILVAYQDGIGKEHYGTEHGVFGAITNPVSTLDYFTKENFLEIEAVKNSEPEKLLDTSCLEELSDNIDEEYSFLVVRKGEEIIYSGNDEWTSIIEEDLPEYNNNVNGDKAVYVPVEEPYLIK